MKVTAIALVALGLTAGAAAAAERVSDLDYMKASRCKGIAEGVGQTDTAGLDAFLKEQKKGRQGIVLERAGSEFDRAKREARSEDRRERMTAELAGACTAYMGPGKDMAAR